MCGGGTAVTARTDERAAGGGRRGGLAQAYVAQENVRRIEPATDDFQHKHRKMAFSGFDQATGTYILRAETDAALIDWLYAVL